MPVLMRWVQTYLYCVAPPARRLESVLPILAPFTAVRARVTRTPCGQTGRCSYVAVLVVGTLLAAVLLLFCSLAWLIPSLMLDGVEAHILLFAGTKHYRYLQQGHQNTISVSIASVRGVPIPPPSPTPLLPLPSLQTTSTNVSTSEEAGYSRQAEVFHAPQTECPRDRESSLDTPRLETPATTEGRVPVEGGFR